MLDNTRLRIAIQKSGRLSEDSRELPQPPRGIKVNLHTQRLYCAGGKYANRYSARA